jgi:predicted RNA-binding Zn ribbon-like protein
MEYRAELIGGHLALDLVNTVAWRLDDRRRVDRLAEPANLRMWLTATGLDRSDAPTARSAADERSQVAVREALVECREIAYGVLHPLAVGEEAGAAELAVLGELVEGAVRTASLVSARPLRWRAESVVDHVRLSVWRLFEEEELDRLRQCDDGGCGWLFLDRSRNGSRRWCSSADCGNRARARRHYQRRHAGASA